MTGIWWQRPYSVLGAVALVWSLMNLWNFGLPGLHMDEVNHLAFIPGVRSEAAAGLHHFRLPDNWFDYQDRKLRYPILGGSVYNSTVSTYLGLGYFTLAGHSTASVRIFSALIALATLVALVSLIGRMFSWPAALLAGLLLATDPSHALSVRGQGLGFWLVILFAALAIHCLLSAADRPAPSRWTAALAGACLGLAVASYFVGLFIALPLALMALWQFRSRPGDLTRFVLAGLLALTPVLYALLSIHLINPTVLANLGMPDWAARESMAVLGADNLRRMWTLIQAAFGSFALATAMAGGGEPPFSGVRLIVWAVLGLLLLYHLPQRAGITGRQRSVIAAAMILVLSSLAGLWWFKATSVHHMLVVTLIATAACAALLRVGRPALRALAGLGMGVLLLTNLLAGVSIHRALQASGGAGYHNESHALVANLMAGPLRDHYPVFVSWGQHLQFLFLTEGNQPYAFHGRVIEDRLLELRANRGPLAVVAGPAEIDAVRALFPDGFEYPFWQRDGPPVLTIVRVD